MKMNDEIKSKIQEHINEACRDHFSVLAKGLKVLPWVCVGMVRNYK